MPTVTQYYSNNSGGDWWLKDEEWFRLERAGWKVNWIKDDPYFTGDRWLGCLAKNAFYPGTERMAKASFEENTDQSIYDEGCECCGPPHDFWEKDVTQPEFVEMFMTIDGEVVAPRKEITGG